jgi:hypothetical protein
MKDGHVSLQRGNRIIPEIQVLSPAIYLEPVEPLGCISA